MKRIVYLSFITITIFFLSACATKQKSRSDVSWTKKQYHNVTAHYNGYFNANVLLNESITKLNAQHQDNYTKVLDLYPYVAIANPKSEAASLDRAIDKLSVVVAVHRVSQWTDDSYLMMAKAQYLKQDYESTEATLEFLKAEFDPERKFTSADRKERLLEAKVLKDKAKKEEKKGKEKEKKIVTKEKNKEKEEKAKARKEIAKAKQKDREARAEAKKEGKNVAAKANEDAVKAKIEAKKALKEAEKAKKEKKKEEKKKEEKMNVEATLNEDGEFDPKLSKIKPKTYMFWQHRPCYQEAMVWLARTYIERERYEDAISLMAKLDRDPKLFSDVRAELSQVKAYYFLKQKSYENAIKPLAKAIALSEKRKEKGRMYYILAQLQSKIGQTQAAYANYEKALNHSNYNYELEFNARLNMALGADNKSDASIVTLKSMLKDSKNKEYKDQIYYSLAQIAFKNGDKQEGINDLQLSIRNNVKNAAQKAESYIQLAKLYYDDQKFVKAKSYYDSTLVILPKTDERFSEITRYANNLTDISKNIQTVVLQDSLLRIADMNTAERKALAKKIMKEKADQEKSAAAILAANTPTIDANSAINLNGAKSTFFAYDEKNNKKGKKEFEKRWGQRTLEDNWRRANKKSNGSFADASKNDNSTNEKDNRRDISDEELNTFFKDVPKTDAEKLVAKQKTEEALFALGALYREKLKNNEKSINAFNDLLTRFPNTKHDVEAWYHLYLTYTDMNDKPKAKEYYDKIIAKYPETTYARVLQDPDYFAKAKKEESALIQYYDEAYKNFKDRKFKESFDMIAAADKRFGDKNTIKPKFALLAALCTGNLQGKEAYMLALKEVIAKFGDLAEGKRAKEMLRLLDANATFVENKKDTDNKKKDAIEDDNAYQIEHDKLHYVIVLLGGTEPDLNSAKNIISDFNREFFKNDGIKMSNVFFGTQSNVPIVVLRKFDSKEVAMRYLDTVNKNNRNFINIKQQPFEIFAISQNNYRKLLTIGALDSYRDFFAKNYATK